MKMNTIIICLLMIFSSCEKETDIRVVQGESFIYEYPGKIFGQTIIGFLIVQDSLIVQDVGFKVFFTENKIKEVKKTISNISQTYEIKDDTGIYVRGLNRTAYISEEFMQKKINSDSLYMMLDKDFLAKSNGERLKVLLELSN